MDRALDLRAGPRLLLAAALLVAWWRTALAGVEFEHPSSNGTDGGGGERAEAPPWAPGDWQRLLRGCDKYVDATGWNGSTAAARSASRLRLHHPFLSLAEGVVPDVTYSVVVRTGVQLEAHPVLVAAQPPGELVALPENSKRCGLNGSFAVVYPARDQPLLQWRPQSGSRDGRNESTLLTVIYPSGPGGLEVEYLRYPLRKDCLVLFRAQYAVIQSTDLDKKYLECPKLTILFEAPADTTPTMQFQEVRLSGSAAAQVEVLVETETAKGLVLGNSSVLRASGTDRWLALRVRSCRSCYYRTVVYALDSREGCNVTLTRTRGEWHSPHHPDFYPPGLHCFITILAPVGHRILLRIPFLELPPAKDPRCEHDSLEIGPLAGRGPSTVVLCGSRRNLTYLSLDERLSIAFHSDPLLEAEGWTVKYEFVRLCRNETHGEANGRVCYPPGKSTSLLYSAPGDCHFALVMPLGYEVQLSFSMLQVSAARASSSCPDSFLEVSSGGVEHRFCGNWTGSPELAALRSAGNAMNIRVHLEEPPGGPSLLALSTASLGFCATYDAVLVNQSLAEDCEFGWVSWGLHCYRVFNESLSWAKANDVCALHGGHLASVTGEDLQSLLDTMLLASAEYKNHHHTFWIGGNDLQYENCFTWADGQEFEYTHWFPGWSSHGGYGAQPSDDGLAQQDCVEVRDVFLFPSKGQGHTATFFWNDRHCAVANPFVCQRLRQGATLEVGRTVECNRTLVLSPEHSRGVVSSPNFPGAYSNSQRCSVEIQAPAGFRVELRFNEFLLEDHPGCEYDYVEIDEPDEERSSGRLCGDWSGRVKLLRQYSHGRRLRVHFVSDFSHAFKGFKAEALLRPEVVPTQLCDARQFQRFADHCYLTASFPEVSWATAQRVCSESQATLAAVRTAAQEAHLRALVAATEGSGSGVWYWLGGRKVGQRADAGSWVDEASAENAADTTEEPPGETASSGTKGTPLCLALQWRPQQNGSDLHWAWKPCDHSGRYICQKKAFTLPQDLNSTRTEPSGTLTSLHHPSHYLNDLHYSVSIVGPPGSRVLLSFSRLDLEWQADCLYDYIEIESPHSQVDPVRICGQHETDLDRFDHFSESNELRLTFHSDYSVTATGFAASWTMVDMASLCHDPPSTLTAYKDRPQSLVSPHYPLFYPNSMHCRYVIKSETPSLPVLVTVEDLDVGVREASGHCLGDRVSVRLSATTAIGSPATISLCGGDLNVQRGFQLLSYGDTLKLTLEAQQHRTRRHRGFNITYHALSGSSLETTLQLPARSRGFVQSLNYPHRPPQGLAYSVRLLAPLGQRVELRFVNRSVASAGAAAGAVHLWDPYRTPQLALRLSAGADNATVSSTLHTLRLSYGAPAAPFQAYFITRKDPLYLDKTVTLLADVSLDSCTPNPCLNGGSCIEDVTSKKRLCSCTPPFAAMFCHVHVCDVGDACSGRGNCSVSSSGALQCSCQQGFQGPDCTQTVDPCAGHPCGPQGRCVVLNGSFVCHCNIFFEGLRCEKQLFRLPYRPLSQRMLEEPFWLGLITVSAVLLLILLVYCIKRKFADKIEKFLAEEIERSKNNPSPPATRYSLSSTQPSLTPASLSPQPCQRSLLSRIRRHSIRSAQGGSSPSDKEQGACTFSFDELLKRSSQSSGSKKQSANSSDSDNPMPGTSGPGPAPKEKESETSRILASLVTSSKSPGKRRMSLDEFIKLSERKIQSIKREETPGDISDVSVASEGSMETSFIQRTAEFHSIREQSQEQNSSSDSISAGPKTSEVQVEVTPIPESPSRCSIGAETLCRQDAVASSGSRSPSPRSFVEQQSSSLEEKAKETPSVTTATETAMVAETLATPKAEPGSPKAAGGDPKGAFLDLLQKTMMAASPAAFPKSPTKQQQQQQQQQDTTQVSMLSLPKVGSGCKQKATDLSVPRKYSVDLPMPKILITANMSSCESEEAPSPPRTPNPSCKTMNYLSPLTIMCSSADRTISESNLSTSGYSSLSSPGLSRCNSSSPIADELENPAHQGRRASVSPKSGHSLSPNYLSCGTKAFQFPVAQAYPYLEAHRPTSPLLQKRRSSIGGALCPATPSLKDRVTLKGKYRTTRHNYQTTSTEDSVDDEGIGIDIAEIRMSKSCIRGGGSVDIILDTGKFDVPERDVSRATSPFAKSISFESPRCRKADKHRKGEKHRRPTPGSSPGITPSSESLPNELLVAEAKLSRNPSKSSMAAAVAAHSTSDSDDGEQRPRRPCKSPRASSARSPVDGRAASPLFVCQRSSSSDSLPSTNEDHMGTDCSSTDCSADRGGHPFSELAIVIDSSHCVPGQTIELIPCLPRLRVHPPPQRREEATNTQPPSALPSLRLISPEGSTSRSLDETAESRSPRPPRRCSLSPSGNQSSFSASEASNRIPTSPTPTHHQILKRQEALVEDDGSDESVSETTVLLPRSPKQQPGSASPRSGGDSTRARTRMGSPFPSSLDSADGGTQGGRDGDATEDLYDSPGDVV
ncbi:uncharacterized protein LOC119461779 [Dermacentor silvarum]|uniref:uncharacterized protein LOC119461779 n=1 Tax=Dermacentor silvarum TaxID=543639 RepID=UPI0021008B56|nr:uncharacterized protein LOC119461779 [Dermacentor silvarum]